MGYLVVRARPAGHPLLAQHHLGIIGLVRIRRLRQRGRGFAIAGLVLSCVWAAIATFAVIKISSLTVPSALKVGDCFNNSGSSASLDSVSVIPCTKPHDTQVFAVFTPAGASNLQVGSALDNLAGNECTARALKVLDPAKVTPDMPLSYVHPDAAGWKAGTHTIICLIQNPKPTLTTSLLKAGAG